MTNIPFDQIAIMVTGPAAIIMIGLAQPWRRVGFLIGLLGQPFCIYSSWKAKQWGIFIFSSYRLFAWAFGFWQNRGKMTLDIREIELVKIKPNPQNPRKNFEGSKFYELQASIREKGVLQPIIVRPKGKGFEIVVGERRWRAACRLADDDRNTGGTIIPAIVRNLTDDEAFEIMVIENLQREDLNEREEAETFKAFLSRKGEKSLPELADRTGIKPQYICRRVRILTLPKKILDTWEKGNLVYGHLEQLLRIEDKKEMARLFEEMLAGNRWANDKKPHPVSWLKEKIDKMAIPLSAGYFDKKECKDCLKNSASDQFLFGIENLTKAHCLDPKCFKQKQNAYLVAHWKESPIGKKHRTNGFRFADDLVNSDFNQFQSWTLQPTKNCFACENFASRISLADSDKERALIVCLNQTCFQKEIQKKKASDRTGASSKSEFASKMAARAVRVGTLFREEYFKQRIPRAIGALLPEDPTIDELALSSLIFYNRGLHAWFYQNLDSNERKRITLSQGLDEGTDEKTNLSPWFNLNAEEIWTTICRLFPQRIRLLLRDACIQTVLQSEFGHDGRYRVARSLGANLQEEWQIHGEYLKAKTKAEILKMGDSLGILKDEKAKTFLFEKLGKKRGKFETCKKGDLIRIFLESGVDLVGKVPEEILIKERKCRICGCTQDHACESGCYWIEEDLCSNCAKNLKGGKVPVVRR